MDGGTGDGRWNAETAFLRRVLIVAAIIVLALFLWQIRAALLLTFGGVIVAVLLLALARPLQSRTGIGTGWALAAVCAALLAVLGLAGLLVGSQVAAQVAGLGDQLPRALAALEGRFGIDLPDPAALGQEAGNLDPAMLSSLAGRIAGASGFVLGALSSLVLVMVGGVFLAADPGLYRRGLTRLLPRSQQQRAEEALRASGEALRLWLGAQFVAMAIVGVLAGLGTWMLGLPSPLALGIFAGLANFVPFIGAIGGAIPALLLALAQGGQIFLWTALLFVAIQQLESNMITPLIERHLVSIPPALLLFSVVAVGLVFGLPGVLLAAPITVLGFVLVKKLYVRDTLGQPTEVPGEEEASAKAQ